MADGDWDFEVVRVDLDGLGIGINAEQRLGMVIAQPEYELDPDSKVPFQIVDGFREAQKDLIEKVFKIRTAESRDRQVPIPFVLFPEAAIPASDPDGLDCLQQQMEQIQEDVIFVGGIEGLSQQEAREIANRFTPNDDTAKPTFGAGQFANICVIAVKPANGQLSWYFQAKLWPSKWEQRRNMAHGKRVLYFVASSNVAFLCQICFDHVATQGTETISESLCRSLVKNTGSLAAPLNFVFVPQYNPDPKADCFRLNTDLILNFQHSHLSNHAASVVVVNKAASIQEPSNFGHSGFYYKKGRWRPSHDDIGPKGYEFYDYKLDDSRTFGVTSAVFRKRTSAVHVATFVPPSLNVGGSGNPHQPLENPCSYLITDGCDPDLCSCLPGTPRTVGKFVECDCLPCKLRDTLFADLPKKDKKKRWQCAGVDQGQLLEKNYVQIRKGLLMLGCARARQVVDLLLQMHKDDKRSNPDLWSGLQSEAVIELLAALSVLAELEPLDFGTSPQWTAWMDDSIAVAVLDGEDRSIYWEDMAVDYIKKFEGQCYRPDARKKPVLLTALRSKGQVQPLVQPYYPRWTETTTPNRLGDENSHTKAARLRFYVCQDGLFDVAKQNKAIKVFLQNEMGCILG